MKNLLTNHSFQNDHTKSVYNYISRYIYCRPKLWSWSLFIILKVCMSMFLHKIPQITKNTLTFLKIMLIIKENFLFYILMLFVKIFNRHWLLNKNMVLPFKYVQSRYLDPFFDRDGSMDLGRIQFRSGSKSFWFNKPFYFI